MTGFEPVTSSLPRKRSTPELHRRFECTFLRQTSSAQASHPNFILPINSIDKIKFFQLNELLSGRPGSNRRHSAWKADALPTELLPQYFITFKKSKNKFQKTIYFLQFQLILVNCLYKSKLLTAIQLKLVVGRAGFEPTKSKDSGVTVRPSWPLWYLPNIFYSKNRADRGTSFDCAQDKLPVLYPLKQNFILTLNSLNYFEPIEGLEPTTC